MRFVVEATLAAATEVSVAAAVVTVLRIAAISSKDNVSSKLAPAIIPLNTASERR